MKKIQIAYASAACAASYQIILIVLIMLRPDLPTYSTTISEWAIGKYGWLMQIAFFISALSYLLLFNILKGEVQGIIGKVGITLLFISFLGTMGVGFFVTDPYPPDFTITATLLHTISGLLGMFCYPIGILLLTQNISKRNVSWSQHKAVLKVTGFLPLLAFIAFNIHLGMYVAPLGENAIGEHVPIGYPPRIMFLTYHLVLIVITYLFIKKEQIKKTQ